MPFYTDFLDMMSSTVTVQSIISRGDDGTPIYATAVSYPALIDERTRNTIGKDGQLVACRGVAYVGTIEPITVNDLVTFNDSDIPIVLLNVNVLSDEIGKAVTILQFQ